MLTKGIEVQKYIKASAGRANLNVVFEDQNQPRHDGKTIYLPNITYKTTEEELKWVDIDKVLDYTNTNSDYYNIISYFKFIYKHSKSN